MGTTVSDIIYSQDVLARLAAYIGKECNMSYTSSYGMATPIAARRFLESLDPYTNVVRHKEYNHSDIMDMLLLNKPIFICAWSTDWNFLDEIKDNEHTSAHAWVIDGYLRQERLVKKYRISDDVLLSTTKETRDFIHCNFGWSGQCDGYYTSGVFDLTQGPTVRDTTLDTSSKTTDVEYYDHLYRVITYDCPPINK